ncbi:alpha-glucosidase-like [Sitophilus oryzae]|uniref:Alpha-glucosidase-like n=1 Tax=Sitophilus oryzae TaxID=7048 RepID=A0A6J2XRT9_SITOR|nr:alpha-glucosidase-like [Sitophilus oryzae]
MTTFIEQERQKQEDIDDEPHFHKKLTCRSFLCSKLVKGVLAALVVAIVCPVVAYHFAISRHYDDGSSQTYSCLVQQEYRIPCGYVGIGEDQCTKVDCCFNTTTGECHHYLPSKYFYQQSSGDIYSTSYSKSPVGSKIVENIQFTATENGKKLLLVLETSSKTNAKQSSSVEADMKNFKINYSSQRLTLEINDSDNDTIFNSANSALIASENYWEWSFQLSNEKLFGLDRNIITLSGNETLTKVIYKNQVDHNTQPVIWALKNSKFYGVLIKHSGPLEITVLASNIVILRSLIGKRIEVELTLGPTPAELYKNQVQDMGLAPKWALGTHNCRKGSEVDLVKLLQIYALDTYSYDANCIHENLFMSLQQENSFGGNLTDFRTTLESLVSSSKFVLSLPPHILAYDNNSLYASAVSLDVLYKDRSGNVYLGKYLKLPVSYPDFTHPSIEDFLKVLMQWIKDQIGLEKISGFVLNNNWPQDDSYKATLNTSFPYMTDKLNEQMVYTLPWNVNTSSNISHFEVHNTYGSLQYELLYNYTTEKENLKDFFIASASKNFADNEPEISHNFQTSWDNFKVYLEKTMFSSITGDYMIGLPVCGDGNSYNKELHETLCLRWYIAAASMPYFRISSDDPYRDPNSLNTLYTTNAVTTTISRRKLFQEYFYTILSKKEPLIRPMYYDYYSNNATYSLENQYAIGTDVIVAQPLTSGKSKLQVYLPEKRKIWYELWGGAMFTPAKKDNYYVTIDIIESDWIAFVAQGSIVALTDSNKLNLYVALDCTKECTANGELYKDNVYISFTATNTSVTVNNLPDSCEYTLGYLKYYGYNATSGYAGRYENNDNLCPGGGSSTTITYITDSK